MALEVTEERTPRTTIVVYDRLHGMGMTRILLELQIFLESNPKAKGFLFCRGCFGQAKLF